VSFDLDVIDFEEVYKQDLIKLLNNIILKSSLCFGIEQDSVISAAVDIFPLRLN
jgi:hypothetical protein